MVAPRPPFPAYQVYVIQNPQGRFYIGLSDDVIRRLKDHNAGISQWTRAKGPWTLVWSSNPMPLSDARKLEIKLKRQGRGSGFYTITGLSRSQAHHPAAAGP